MSMKAGPELDSLIAEKVMGWKCSERNCDGKFITRCGACGREGHGNCYGPGRGGEIQIACIDRGHRPNYSQDIAAAWQVVEKMHLFNAAFLLGSNEFGWKIVEDGQELRITIAEAATAPLVICLAALKIAEERRKPPQVADNMVHLPCGKKPDRCNNCTEYVCRTCYPDHNKTCAYSCPVCHQKACGHSNEPKL